jgi:hypothetical protein
VRKGAGGSDEGSDISNVFKKRRIFLKFVQESKFLESRWLKTLQYAALLFLVLTLAFCLANHFIVAKQLDQNA